MDHPVFRSTFHKYRKIFRALLVRTILSIHGALAIYQTVQMKNDERYYGILAWMVPMSLMETGIILHFRQGCEWRRVCTPFIVYLLSIVPALWLQRLQVTENHGNITTPGMNKSEDPRSNLVISLGLVQDKPSEVKFVLDSMDWTNVLEQSMMFVLILCRWLLPRGHIDRNSLSQLLIMYSAISADILDFTDFLQVDEIRNKKTFMFIGLGFWSWSMAQFTLVVTTAFGFRRRPEVNENHNEAMTVDWDRSEILSILSVFFMQDGPFLALRIYAIFFIRLSNYFTIFFFSLKNILTLILGLYRLMVLWGCVSREGNDLLTMEEIAKSKESLATIESETGKKKKTKKKWKGKEPLSVNSNSGVNKTKKKTKF